MFGKRVGILLVLGCWLQAVHAVETGTLAPDFTLKSHTGENLRLYEFRGDVVLVNFWGSWCGSCSQELSALQSLHTLLSGQDLHILGINLDNDEAAARNVIRRLDLEFPILFDLRKSVSDAYQPEDIPSTYLIDRDGIVRFTYEGFKPGQVGTYEQNIKQLLAE